MDQKQTEQLVAEAARWYVRLRAEDCTLGERQAFQAWLMQSPAHAQAYERARDVSRKLKEMASQDPRLRELAAAALADRAAPPPRALPWRFAAALLLGVGLAAMLVLRQVESGRADVAHYANSGLQQQLVVLSDGSRVHLDVGAQLDVEMTSSGRALALHEGRAYFEVAHDASRPFAVVAGGVRTVALGTRFQVALAPEGVNVTLAQGSVAVTRQGSGWKEILRPGEQLRVSNDRIEPIRLEVDAELLLGWSSGRLVFRGTPLVEVLDEINRYAPVKLRLGDESLGKVSVGGTFVAGADSAQVANALVAALPLNAVRVGAREIVLFRRYDSAD